MIESRISGHIPSIQFAWDKSQLKRGYLKHIDEMIMLAIADYGPSHQIEKNDISTAELTSPVLEASPNLLEKLKKINSGTETKLNHGDIVQSFRNDLYKLDHLSLMKSIQESKDKLKAGLRRREKKMLKEQKFMKFPKAEIETPPQEGRKKVDGFGPEGVPLRLSMIQKNQLGVNASNYLNQLEEQPFFEEEWSDDDEDFDNTVGEKKTRVTVEESTGGISEHSDDKRKYSLSHELDDNNPVIEELNFKWKPESFRTLSRQGVQRVSGPLQSPLRVRDMQTLLSESSEEGDDEVDLIEDEWSDEEKNAEEDIPKNKNGSLK